MKVLHIVPGTGDVSNGMAAVAHFLEKEQGDAGIVDLNHGLQRIYEGGVEEVWVHGMWLPKEWLACWRALKAGKHLVRMTHGSLSPLYLKYQSPFRKWLVGLIERFFLRRCDRIVATCEAEKGWIERYLGRRCPPIEVTDIKRFFKTLQSRSDLLCNNSRLHLLYLGRRHPLKGLEYLEEAVKQVQNLCASASLREIKISIELRVVSNAFGDELEKVWEWCDVLVLPTLSENFGLVVAEALERGKRVITTDGAPAWENECKIENGKLRAEGGEILSHAESAEGAEIDGGKILVGYDGRLMYLKGYRDDSSEVRISLLKSAIENIAK